jgi:hypothetical protein
MARRYSVNGYTTVGGSYKTLLGLTGGTTMRPRIYQIQIGITSAPADLALEWLVQRYTAAGTATAVTPNKLDPADPAAICTAGRTHTVEPTYTSTESPFDLGFHQKASAIWQAWDQLAQLVIPATAANGIGIQTLHGTATPTALATFHYDE